MIHVTIERANIALATQLAREAYQRAVQAGRHAILDAPGDLRTNLPERRLSAADVLFSARAITQSPTTTKL